MQYCNKCNIILLVVIRLIGIIMFWFFFQGNLSHHSVKEQATV